MIKTLKITLTDDGIEKRFLITRLSASATEDWADEFFFALANAGVDIPDEITEMGFSGIMQIGLKTLGKVPYEKAKPLLAKMMTCVQFMPNPEDDRIVRPLIESDIEDVRNRYKLRKEVFSLHTDFLQAV